MKRLVLAAVALVLLALALPVSAHHPEIAAQVICDGPAQIAWTSTSWMQDPTNDGASGNPDIRVYFNDVEVARGAYTAANGYQFSGVNPWPGGTQVVVKAVAVAPFNNGNDPGSFREVTVTLPEDCPVPTTTTTTTTQITTTTEATTTTAPPFDPTTTQVTVTTTVPVSTTVPVTTTVPFAPPSTLPHSGLGLAGFLLSLVVVASAGGFVMLVSARRH